MAPTDKLQGIVSDEELEELRQAFEAFDINGNWSLEFAEISAVLKVLGLGHITDEDIRMWMRQLDRDGNGMLEFDEFVQMYAEHRCDSACTAQGAVHILGKRPHDRTPEDLQKLANYLVNVMPWANQFTKPMLLEICRYMEVAKFKPGQWLWQQESQVPHMVGILEGTVSLWQHPAVLRAMSTMQRSTTSKSLAASASLATLVDGPPSPHAQPSRADLDSPPLSPGASQGIKTRPSHHHKRGVSISESPLSSPKPSVASPKATDRKSIRFQVPEGDSAVVEQEVPSRSRRLSEAGSMRSRRGSQHSSFKSNDNGDSSRAARRRSMSNHPSFKEVQDASKSEVGRMSQRRRTITNLSFLEPAEHEEQTKPLISLLGSRASARLGLDHLSISLSVQAPASAGDDADASAFQPALSPWERSAQAKDMWRKLGVAVKFYRRAALARQTLDTVQGTTQSLTAKVPRASRVLTSSLIKDGVISSVDAIESVPASIVQALHELASQHQQEWQQGRDGALLRNPKSISMSRQQRDLLKAASIGSQWDGSASNPLDADEPDDPGHRSLTSASSKRSRVLSLIQSLRRAVSVSKPHDSPVCVGFSHAGQWLNERVLLPLLGSPGDGSSAARVGALAASHVLCVLITKDSVKQAISVVTGGPGFANANKNVDSMVYKPDFLMHLAGKSPLNVCEEATLSHYLGMVGALCELPYDLRARLGRAVIPQAYPRGELVIRQGDVPHAMYVVVSGAVGVFKDSTGQLVARSRNQGTSERISNMKKTSASEQADDKSSEVLSAAVSILASRLASRVATSHGQAAAEDADDEDADIPVSRQASIIRNITLPAQLAGAAPSSATDAAEAPSTDAPAGETPDTRAGVRFVPAMPSLRVRSITAGGNTSIRHRLATAGVPGVPQLVRTDSKAAQLAADFISRAKSAPGMKRPNAHDLIDEEEEAEDAFFGSAPTLRPARTFIPELSDSAKERHALMGSGMSSQAAAMRAKHAALRGKLGGSSDRRVLLTEQHAESASKVASLLLGDKLGSSMSRHANATASHTSVHQMEELEKMLGELHQQLGAFRTVGEQELLASIPGGGEAGPPGGVSPQESVYLKRREHSVLAMQACFTLQIEMHAYSACVSEWRQRQLAERLAFLSKIPCCARLKKPALIAIDSSLQWMDVCRGAVLQAAGTACQGIILVQSGTLGLYHPPSRTSTQTVLQQHAAAVERRAMDISQWADDEPTSPTAPAPKLNKMNSTVSTRQLLTQPSQKDSRFASSKSLALVSQSTMTRNLVSQPSQASKGRMSTGLQHSPTLLRTSRLGSQASTLSPRTLARQMSVAAGNANPDVGPKDGAGVLPSTATGNFSTRQALRCVGLLGPGDFCGEDGLVGGVHQVSIVAETACKVAVLKTSDMLLLEEAGLTALIRHARHRSEQHGKQAATGPDLWAPGAAPVDQGQQPKGGTASSRHTSLATNTLSGRASAPADEQTAEFADADNKGAIHDQGWFVAGTGVALALAAVAPPVQPKPQTPVKSSRRVSNLALMGGPSPEAVQAYEHWLEAIGRHAQHAAALLPAAATTPADKSLTPSLVQSTVASPGQVPTQLGYCPSRSSAPTADQSVFASSASPAVTANTPQVSATVHTSTSQHAPTSVPERALALLQAARTPLVLGLHKAPAHIDTGHLHHLPKPAGLANILLQPEEQDTDASAVGTHSPVSPQPMAAVPEEKSYGAEVDPADCQPPPRTMSARQRARQQSALTAPPLLNKPAHLLNSTACLAHLTDHLIPGVVCHTKMGLDPVELQDEKMTSDVWGGRSEVSKLRSAQPSFLVGKKQADLFRTAFNDLLKASPSKKLENRSPKSALASKTRPATASAVWAHSHSNLSLLYSQAGQAPAMLGSLNSGLHFSTAALTSYRWSPHRPTPQEMMTPRSSMLATTNSIAAAALQLRTW